MTTHNGWIRVTRDNPCPICDKPDNCTVSSNGMFVWCGRISDGSIRQNNGGQYLHRLSNDRQLPIRLPVSKPRPKAPDRDFAQLAARYFAEGQNARRRLSDSLHVDEQALERLEVGWDPFCRTWTFPERDAAGKIIGINDRFANGDKKRRRGSKAGLTYADAWSTGDGPIVLVEGGSDTAALVGIGLKVVGRPSNCGGVDLLVELLREFPSTQEIIVIGERDQKPNGHWPGREGAIRTAQRLSEELERAVAWSLPPDDAKDARAWVGLMPAMPSDRLACLFLDGLDIQLIMPPPRIGVSVPTGPVVSLEYWRQSMKQARLDSLSRPGFYLDTSTTGSGKSTVDFQVILHVERKEVA